jgi:hypothetical protein
LTTFSEWLMLFLFALERRRDVFFFDTIQPCACQASFLPDLYKTIISLIKKRAMDRLQGFSFYGAVQNNLSAFKLTTFSEWLMLFLFTRQAASKKNETPNIFMSNTLPFYPFRLRKTYTEQPVRF